MKNNLLKTIIILIAVTFVTLQSCEKKGLMSEQEMTENVEYQLPQSIVENVEMENGILQFQSNEHINQVMNELENEYERLTNEFDEKYKDLSEDEMQEMAEVINFNPYIVFETFEQYFGFKSLRADIAEKEIIWLNNEELDMENNPNNHNIDGEGQRTVITPDGVLMIGNSIFIALENGTTYEITDGNFETLEKIRNNNSTVSENIVIHGENFEKLDWKSVATRSSYWTNKVGTKTYKLTGRITIDNRPWVHYVKGTSKIYWLDGSSWKSQRYTHMNAKVKGTIYKYRRPHRYYATVNKSYPSSGTVYDRTSVDVKQSFGDWFKTKRNAVYSTHYNDKVGTKTLYLTW